MVKRRKVSSHRSKKRTVPKIAVNTRPPIIPTLAIFSVILASSMASLLFLTRNGLLAPIASVDNGASRTRTILADVLIGLIILLRRSIIAAENFFTS